MPAFLYSERIGIFAAFSGISVSFRTLGPVNGIQIAVDHSDYFDYPGDINLDERSSNGMKLRVSDLGDCREHNHFIIN